MPINAGYEYANAEKKYFQATNMQERIAALEELIRATPKHKSSEHHVAELKNRLRKFKEQQEKSKKSGKSTHKTIKKEGFQIVLLGLPNSGKSSLLAKLTNAKSKISPVPFTTKEPEVGTLDYEGIKAQIVDMPSIGSENFDSGIINTADMILIILENLEDLEKVAPNLVKTSGRKLILVNKSDLLSLEELRKLEERIKSKKLNALPISCLSNLSIITLKEKIIQGMQVIRIYMKEPNHPVSQIPMVMSLNSTLKDVAEKIYKGFSKKIKETRITGPSSKFPNQKIGLSHILKDKDIVEFHTF